MHVMVFFKFSLCQDKVKHLQMEVDEERHTVELLTDRVSRSRDQV